jgi:hypothetical protein
VSNLSLSQTQSHFLTTFLFIFPNLQQQRQQQQQRYQWQVNRLHSFTTDDSHGLPPLSSSHFSSWTGDTLTAALVSLTASMALLTEANASTVEENNDDPIFLHIVTGFLSELEFSDQFCRKWSTRLPLHDASGGHRNKKK